MVTGNLKCVNQQCGVSVECDAPVIAPFTFDEQTLFNSWNTRASDATLASAVEVIEHYADKESWDESSVYGNLRDLYLSDKNAHGLFNGYDKAAEWLAANGEVKG